MEFARRPRERVRSEELKEVLVRAESNNVRHPGRIIFGIRDLLEEDPKEPKLIITSGNGTNAEFSLNADVNFIDEETKEEEFPTIQVNERKKGIQIAGKTIRFFRQTWPVFLYFARNPKTDVSGEKLREVAEEAGYSGLFQGKDAISILRRKFEQAGLGNLNLFPVCDFGPYPFYRLDANVEFIGEERPKPKLEFIEAENQVTIDGRILVLNDKQARLLQVLARSVGIRLNSKQLSNEVFGIANPRITRVQAVVSELKNKLNRDDAQFLVSSGIRGVYSWAMLQGVDVVYNTALRSEVDQRLLELQHQIDQLRDWSDRDRIEIVRQNFPVIVADAERFLDAVYQRNNALYQPWEYLGGDKIGEPEVIQNKYGLSFMRHRPSREFISPEADLFCEVSEILFERKIRESQK